MSRVGTAVFVREDRGYWRRDGAGLGRSERVGNAGQLDTSDLSGLPTQVEILPITDCDAGHSTTWPAAMVAAEAGRLAGKIRNLVDALRKLAAGNAEKKQGSGRIKACEVASMQKSVV